MTLIKVLLFSVFVLFSYTFFANILPQVQSDAVEEETQPDKGGMDQDGQIAWGEKLFSGKGTCTLCHNNMGRAPDLLQMDLGTLLPARLTDSRYQGVAKNGQGAKAVEAYIRESMVDPSAYVVKGFGKKGSDDTISPMPKIDGPPISLSRAEEDALIAFLQDKGGFDVTVPLPETGAEPAADGADEGDGEDAGPAETAESAIGKFGCAACHDMFGSGAELGPELEGLGERMSKDEIREAIIDPNATIAEGFDADTMPADFGEQMYVSELQMIVDYLKNLKSTGAAQ